VCFGSDTCYEFTAAENQLQIKHREKFGFGQKQEENESYNK